MPTFTIGPSGCDYTTPQAWLDDNYYYAGEEEVVGEIQQGSYPGLLKTGSGGPAFRLKAAAGHEFRGSFGTGPILEYVYAPLLTITLEHISTNSGYWEGAGFSTDMCAINIGGDVRSCGATGLLLSATPGVENATYFYGIKAANVHTSIVHDLDCQGYRGGGIGAIGIAGAAHHCVVDKLNVYNNLDPYYGTPYADLVGITGANARNNAVFRLTCTQGPKTYFNGASSTSGPAIDYNAVDSGGVYDGGPTTRQAARAELDSSFHLAASAPNLQGQGAAPHYASNDIDGQDIGNDIGVDSHHLPTGSGVCHGQQAHAAGAAAVLVVNSGVYHGGYAHAVGVDHEPPRGVYHGGHASASGSGAVRVRGSGVFHGGSAYAAGRSPTVTRYYVDARGLYRVFAPAVYRLYRSQAGPPAEGSAPFATAASLPATPADVFGVGVWYVSMSYFDGVYDSGFAEVGPNGETYLVLEVIAGQSHVPPVGPLTWQLIPLAGGVVRVSALLYVAVNDAAPDEWAIAYTTNGSTPAAGNPTVTQAMAASPVRVLAYDLPAQVDGTTLKVRLQTRRNDGTAEAPVWVYSVQSGVLSITVDATGATAPPVAVTWDGSLDLDEG